jgi:hypothetical protein
LCEIELDKAVAIRLVIFTNHFELVIFTNHFELVIFTNHFDLAFVSL